MALPVLVITNAYPDFAGSYHGIFVRRIVEDMAGQGWSSHVLVPRIYKKSAPSESFPGHTVTRFPFPTAGKLLIEYEKPPLIRLAVLLLSGTLAAVRLITAKKCLLIHAHWAFPAGVIGLVAARLTGRKLILTVHGSDWRLAATRKGIAEFFFHSVAAGADRIISVSGIITEYLLGQGLRGEKVITCPMGVDSSTFHREVEHDHSLDGKFAVVSSRSHLPFYRLADLIKASAGVAEKIPGFQLVLAGEGSESQNLKNLASELKLGDKVNFTGRLEPEKLARILAASRVYISTSPQEGSSVSLLEAMNCGCLPVVTDIPANKEWIEHGENGLLFPTGNIDALAQALLEAAKNSTLREQAAPKNYRIVAERGLWSRQIEILDQCYKDILRE
jgi:glycosyltransferase involved in cell wall biosynthesis